MRIGLRNRDHPARRDRTYGRGRSRNSRRARMRRQLISANSGILLPPLCGIRHSERSVPMLGALEIVLLRFPSGRPVEESLFDFIGLRRITKKQISLENTPRKEIGR